MSTISANAVDFFKFLGISQEEMQDIRAIFGKTKPMPNKEAVVTILNKFLGKANDVILRDGVWILEDKVIGNQDQTIRVYPVTPAKDTGTNTGAETDLEESFKVPHCWGQSKASTQTENGAQTQNRTQDSTLGGTLGGTQTQQREED